MKTPTLVRWSLVAEAAPAWRRWDAEYVVHHALANDTHRLSETAGRVLQCLVAAESMGTRELALACALEEYETRTTLMTLAKLGFVERC